MNVFPCADRAAFLCVGLVSIVRIYPYARCFVGIAGMPFSGPLLDWGARRASPVKWT